MIFSLNFVAVTANAGGKQVSLKRTRTGSINDVARDHEPDKALKVSPNSISLFVALNP